MNFLESLFLKALLWAIPLPNRIGQVATMTGDVTTETSAKLFIYILKRLAELEESEAR